MDHILNFIVKAILYGEGISDFNNNISGVNDGEAFAIWRLFGTIGKVHDCVKYILQSDQHRQLFISLQTELKDKDLIFKDVERLLMKDRGIRWNSTFSMLLGALKLREAIKLFQLQQRPLRED